MWEDVPLQDMKTYRDSGSIAPPLLTLAHDGGKWFASCVSYFTPQEGRETLVPILWRLAGSQTWSRHYGEDNLLPVLGFEPHIFQSIA